MSERKLPIMAKHEFLWDRSVHPFCRSWEEWAASWYKWMISIPKKINPCIDLTGRYCSLNQHNKNVWFLAGTFGNHNLVIRNCQIPYGRAILLPILVKEDSLVEDSDLSFESQLSNRAREATDMLSTMKVSIDGKTLLNIEKPVNEEAIRELQSYRVHSKVINLDFPEGNVYDVAPGPTRSVSDGFWLFVKPFEIGKHTIHFQGETKLTEKFTLDRMLKTDVYSQVRDWLDAEKSFRVDVLYRLLITERA